MVDETPVVFSNHGVTLSGRFLHRPGQFDRRPIVLVVGSWLTVKEQMPLVYARRLVEAGYNAFIFDFSGFGESRGEPRQVEMPSRKVDDLRAAVEFLRTVGFVDAERIGAVGICGSAQNVLVALAEGVPIRTFASVAGWYHDPPSVVPFYGGADGIALRLARAREATIAYVQGGDLSIVPAYEDGNDRAGMFFPLDYYARPDRGAIPEWKNEMSEMTWTHWLTFDGLAAAKRVSAPSLFVHSDGCVFPHHVKQVHAAVKGPKELVWTIGNQIDFYDQPEQVRSTLTAIDAWFKRTL
jgi:dienelactone hydrolase